MSVIPSVGYRDTIEFSGYTDEEEAFNAAALMAIYRWRKSVGDLDTLLSVTRVHVEAAREEA